VHWYRHGQRCNPSVPRACSGPSGKQTAKETHTTHLQYLLTRVLLPTVPVILSLAMVGCTGSFRSVQPGPSRAPQVDLITTTAVPIHPLSTINSIVSPPYGWPLALRLAMAVTCVVLVSHSYRSIMNEVTWEQVYNASVPSRSVQHQLFPTRRTHSPITLVCHRSTFPTILTRWSRPGLKSTTG